MCVFLSVHACDFVCVCVSLHLQLPFCVGLNVCFFVSLCVCVFVYNRASVHFMCVFVSVCVRVCVCLCLFVCVSACVFVRV